MSAPSSRDEDATTRGVECVVFDLRMRRGGEGAWDLRRVRSERLPAVP
jgi:hypothetical protein